MKKTAWIAVIAAGLVLLGTGSVFYRTVRQYEYSFGIGRIFDQFLCFFITV